METGTSARSGRIVAGVANPIAPAGTPLLNTGRSSLLLTPHSSARNPQQPVTLPQSQEQQPPFQVTRQQSALLLNTSGARPLTPSGPRAAPLLLSGNNKPTLMTLTPGRRTGLSNQSSARLLTPGQSQNYLVGPGAPPQSSTLVPAGQQQQQQQLGEQAATPGPTFLSSRSSMQVQVLPPQPKQPLSPRDMKEMKKGSALLGGNSMKKDNINTTASKPELLLNSTESQHFGMMAMTAPHPHLHADFHDHIGLNVSKGLTEKHEDFAHLHWIEPKPGHLHPPAGIPGFTSPQIVHYPSEKSPRPQSCKNL